MRCGPDDYASYCDQKLRRIKKNGVRKQPPNSLELQVSKRILNTINYLGYVLLGKIQILQVHYRYLHRYRLRFHTSQVSTYITSIDLHHRYRLTSQVSTYITGIDLHHRYRLASQVSTYITGIDLHHRYRPTSQVSTYVTGIDIHHRYRLTSQVSTYITGIDLHHRYRHTSQVSI